MRSDSPPSVANKSPQPSRRWPRISLRAFLVGFTLIAAALGWYAQRVHRQRQAVRAVIAQGGSVWYDAEVNAELFTDGRSATSGWDRLGSWFGRDWFQTVVVVDLADSGGSRSLSDEDLKSLRPLIGLRKLTLRNTMDVTAAGVRSLGEMPSLERLYLHCPDITAEDLRPLQRLPNLTYLALSTPLGDDGLRELSQFPALTELEISSEGVTDDGVRELKHLRLLTRLELSGTYRMGGVEAELKTSNPNLGIDDGSFNDWRFGRER